MKSPFFISPFPHHTPRHAQTLTCTTDPPTSNPPPSDSQTSNPSPSPSIPPLRPIDKIYLSKVRARLFNTKPSNATTPKPTTDDLLTAGLPDDPDALDDILFDRTPDKAHQVPLFGGWLDEGLAGRKSRHAQHSPHPVESAAKATDEVHVTRAAADAFAAAMHLFNKGSYRQAVALYNKAVQLVGLSSRTGGQYQLWHAQALDAAGDRKVATETLQQLASHPDADVRKVSQELLFIITAPALELDASMFMHVPSLDDAPTPSGALLTSNYGPLRTALVNKSPEPYTLQWYIKKERPPKVTKDNSAIQALALMAAVFSTFTFMLVSPH